MGGAIPLDLIATVLLNAMYAADEVVVTRTATSAAPFGQSNATYCLPSLHTYIAIIGSRAKIAIGIGATTILVCILG